MAQLGRLRPWRVLRWLSRRRRTSAVHDRRRHRNRKADGAPSRNGVAGHRRLARRLACHLRARRSSRVKHWWSHSALKADRGYEDLFARTRMTGTLKSTRNQPPTLTVIFAE